MNNQKLEEVVLKVKDVKIGELLKSKQFYLNAILVLFLNALLIASTKTSWHEFLQELLTTVSNPSLLIVALGADFWILIKMSTNVTDKKLVEVSEEEMSQEVES